MIVCGNIESLPNSFPGDMAWLMNTYIEMVYILFNYIHFLRTGNWKGYLEDLFDFSSLLLQSKWSKLCPKLKLLLCLYVSIRGKKYSCL